VAGVLVGCAGASLTAEQVASSHWADAQRLCEAPADQDQEACVAAWLDTLMRGSPADALPRQAVTDMEGAIVTCRRLGFADPHPGAQACVTREFAAAGEARERRAAALFVFGAGLHRADQAYSPPTVRLQANCSRVGNTVSCY
jgi:hypothetical protein